MNLNDYEEVTPTKVVTKSDPGSDKHRYRYRFGEAHIDELDGNAGDVFSGVDSEVELVDGVLKYKYPGKTEVLVTRDGVLAHKDAPKSEARHQAYFAISILESNGYVSGISRSKV